MSSHSYLDCELGNRAGEDGTPLTSYDTLHSLFSTTLANLMLIHSHDSPIETGLIPSYQRGAFLLNSSDASPRIKMGMAQPGPSLGPGPMASRPILGVMGRLISPKCYGLDGPFGIMGRPKYFSIILNHEYYQHF